jgi:Cd2+/Zn2+-exporting ATPase
LEALDGEKEQIQHTRRALPQHQWVMPSMFAVLVPTTMTGLPNGPAVVLHEGSTLLVVGNALRLLEYES